MKVIQRLISLSLFVSTIFATPDWSVNPADFQYNGSVTSKVYIDGLILKITNKITIIPVEHYQRPRGSSNYTFKKLVSLWLDTASDFKIFPLRLVTIFVIIIKPIIILYLKIVRLGKNKKPQYIIRSTTFSKK